MAILRAETATSHSKLESVPYFAELIAHQLPLECYMVADIFELHGWDAHFLGVNTLVKEFLKCIDEIQPDVIGLSLAVYSNIPALQATLEAIHSNFKGIDILVGGHAFAWGGVGVLKKYPGSNYFESLAQLEVNI